MNKNLYIWFNGNEDGAAFCPDECDNIKEWVIINNCLVIDYVNGTTSYYPLTGIHCFETRDSDYDE